MEGKCRGGLLSGGLLSGGQVSGGHLSGYAGINISFKKELFKILKTCNEHKHPIFLKQKRCSLI